MNDELQPPEPEAGGNAEKAPVRVCPNCSAQTQTFSDTCPHCGASFIRSRRMRARRRFSAWSKTRKIVVLGMIAVLIGVAIGAGVIIKVNHDNQVAQQHKEEQELAEEKREERAEEEKLADEELESEEELERLEAKYGRESVVELQEAITNDANSEAEEGFSEYVSETTCEAEGGEVDTTLAAQNFDCLAVTTEEGSTQEGYRYTGTINYAKGSFSWRFGGP